MPPVETNVVFVKKKSEKKRRLPVLVTILLYINEKNFGSIT